MTEDIIFLGYMLLIVFASLLVFVIAYSIIERILDRKNRKKSLTPNDYADMLDKQFAAWQKKEANRSDKIE